MEDSKYNNNFNGKLPAGLDLRIKELTKYNEQFVNLIKKEHFSTDKYKNTLSQPSKTKD